MPGYVANVLSKFQHDTQKHSQDTTYRYILPLYGAKTQYATQDEIPPLMAKQCLNIQKVTGSVLYYARAVYPTFLMPLHDIATEQTKDTEKTQAATNQLLYYLAPHTDATIRYHSSYSQRCIVSFSFTCAQPSRWHVILWRKTPKEKNLNGSILNVASVIKHVVATAAESEVGACFQNTQSGAPIRITLTELDHKQPSTILRTDNLAS
jgi:hypothetical protein